MRENISIERGVNEASGEGERHPMKGGGGGGGDGGGVGGEENPLCPGKMALTVS